MNSDKKTDRANHLSNIFLVGSILMLIGSLIYLGIVLNTHGIPWKYQKSSILSGVPKNLQNNAYLQQRERGCCKKLTGDVAVIVVMVSDSVGVWDEQSTSELKTALESQSQKITTDAAAYQAELSIQFHYYNATLTGDISAGEYSDDWQDPALENAGLPTLADLHKAMEEEYGVQEAPLMFAFNKTGRAYAQHGGNEFMVLYARKNFDSFQHELSHLFGAQDYYYPQQVKDIANELFSDSIMLGGETVDPLMAYLIGWTKELSDSAEEFLQKTNHITLEDMERAGDNQSITGTGTREFSSGTYTGDLVRGEPHGTGTMEYNNGGWYTGQWTNGSMSGVGKGKIFYKTGNCYEGEFLDGAYHGQGTLTKPDGEYYEGTWENGKFMSGTGKTLYESGASYVGEFQNGNRHGEGTYTYPSGSVYTGQWADGERHGQGTYNFTDGSWYTGGWENGEKVGAGKAKEIQSNGVYEGDVLNGKRHGQGTYTWNDGDVYVGQWTDGDITGYGTVTKPDGSVFTGYWIDGKLQK